MNQISWERVRVVSWDIDGTLYDLHQFMAALKGDLLKRVLRLQWYSVLVDLSRLVRFKIHMDKVRKGAPEYRVGTLEGRDTIGLTMAKLYAELLPDLGLLQGVRELLDWIESTGRMQIVFSDYRQSTKLQALEVSAYFAYVFAGEDIGYLKPSPLAFHEIIEQLRIEPDQMLHIGDRTDTDGAAAPEVGFQVAIIGEDFPTAEHLLEALRAQQ